MVSCCLRVLYLLKAMRAIVDIHIPALGLAKLLSIYSECSYACIRRNLILSNINRAESCQCPAFCEYSSRSRDVIARAPTRSSYGWTMFLGRSVRENIYILMRRHEVHSYIIYVKHYTRIPGSRDHWVNTISISVEAEQHVKVTYVKSKNSWFCSFSYPGRSLTFLFLLFCHLQ